MKAVPVSDGIHWVGVIDWNLRDFHGYETPRGTSYNAYLVIGADKIALVDTVKTPFVPELLERIASVVPLEKIDYIIVNHVEPDHNSGMMLVLDAIPQAKIFASAGGVKGIAGYHGEDIAGTVTAVGEADVIDLGGKTLLTRLEAYPMDVIAPSHGVIWRNDTIATVVDAYNRLTSGETIDKLVVAYSTMWTATDILAREIADGASRAGVEVRLYDLAESPKARITTNLLDARALLLGSPTLHRQMHHRTAAYIQYIAGLKPKGKLAGVFGSYGWSSGATKQMAAQLEAIGFEMPEPDFTVAYKPAAEEIEAAQAWGAAFAERVKAIGRANQG